jgi:NhaP-type Na+/H+ or K+/H+ antiporter
MKTLNAPPPRYFPSRVARRVGAPYPVFLALGGALLAFLPGAPSFSVPPEVALALFVAPGLLDAAYDASLRDLRDNWAPVTPCVLTTRSATMPFIGWKRELDWLEMAGGRKGK